jgi:hypothetical protein
MKTALAAKVSARNKVNKLANDSYPKIIEALKPFLGQKILKVNGTLMEKVAKVLPKIDCYRAYYTCGAGYSLKVEITEFETSPDRFGDGSIAHYQETSLYLGDLTTGVLTKLYDAPNHRTDFTEEEIIQTREKIKEFKEQERQFLSSRSIPADLLCP